LLRVSDVRESLNCLRITRQVGECGNETERGYQAGCHPVPKQTLLITIDEDAPASPLVVPRLLRIADAAKYLSATTWQIETLLREKTIPSFVIGKRRVVDRLELDRYVETRNAEAKAALETSQL
jgi:excisionase family DNA binding protein